MRTESFVFSGHQYLALPARLWLPDGEPKLLLQITHGMTEHIGRYQAFAEKMTAHGIAVAGFDLRGHGSNPGDPAVASFGVDGWEASLQDMRLFFDVLSQRFPTLPHCMLGFSLGSFLLREYLGRWPNGIHRAIIMGTGHQPGWLLSIMMGIVKTQISKAGCNATTALVHQLSFGAYNQHFKPARTEFDWLCSDEKQLDDYIADPLCKQDISSGLFHQLLAAMKRTGGKNACAGWDPSIPVLLLSGQNDPVGNMGKGVQNVKQQLDAAGIQDVSIQLFEGARHILLDEKQNGASQKAIDAILSFLLVKNS